MICTMKILIAVDIEGISGVVSNPSVMSAVMRLTPEALDPALTRSG